MPFVITLTVILLLPRTTEKGIMKLHISQKRQYSTTQRTQWFNWQESVFSQSGRGQSGSSCCITEEIFKRFTGSVIDV